ncbi:MAG: hypothetical protein JST86_02705 [Bacteroidetes bacterium]|nr:hypothetical protein [Bacteroidota bacterium]
MKSKDSITDFIDDEEYYRVRKEKEQVENATWAIYIFAIVTLLSYVVSLMINFAAFRWESFAVNALIIFGYFCLGYYSNFKPYTAIVSTLVTVIILFLASFIITEIISTVRIIITIVFVVYIAMRTAAAKHVQEYEGRQKETKNETN